MQNRVARLPFPLPDFFNELLAPQLCPAYSLLRKLALDDVLRRDAGVVRTRDPKHPATVHSFIAAKNVLKRIVQSVAHVQRTGDVRRRDHHRKGGTAGFCRFKQPGFHPVAVPFRLDILVTVSPRELHMPISSFYPALSMFRAPNSPRRPPQVR